ncbi:MAG: ABC transporter permease, partial [Pseudomonadota bacterium]|nr:ABC transporter permease [Pseudomonadota bacterium]
MEVIDLAWWKLGLAALLILALAATGYLARLGITRSLLVAATRT